MADQAADPSPAETDEPTRREPAFNLPITVIALIAICAAIHIVRAYWLDANQDFAFLLRAAFIPIRYSGQYDIDFYAYSSPFTYAFLHGGFAHLAINMVWLAAFGSPLANRLGPVRFMLFWVVTGLAAAGLHYVVHPLDQSPLIGASGAISGMMGAAARFGFRIDRSSGKPAFAGAVWPMSMVFRSRGVVAFLALWMIINLVTGLIGFEPGADDQIAWEAHVGGFVVGFFAINLFDRRNRSTPV